MCLYAYRIKKIIKLAFEEFFELNNLLIYFSFQNSSRKLFLTICNYFEFDFARARCRNSGHLKMIKRGIKQELTVIRQSKQLHSGLSIRPWPTSCQLSNSEHMFEFFFGRVSENYVNLFNETIMRISGKASKNSRQTSLLTLSGNV